MKWESCDVADFGPRCGFCGKEMRAMVPRHSGAVCEGCCAMYVEGPDGEWALDRLMYLDVWKQYPRGCLVVLGKSSEVEG